MSNTLQILKKYRQLLTKNKFEDTPVLQELIYTFFKENKPWTLDAINGIPAIFIFLAELPAPQDPADSYLNGDTDEDDSDEDDSEKAFNKSSTVKAFYRRIMEAITEDEDNPFWTVNADITSRKDYRHLRDAQGRSFLAYTDDLECILAARFMIGRNYFEPITGDPLTYEAEANRLNELLDNEGNGILIQRYEAQALYNQTFNKNIDVNMNIDVIYSNSRASNAELDKYGIVYKALFIGNPSNTQKLFSILQKEFPQSQKKISSLDLALHCQMERFNIDETDHDDPYGTHKHESDDIQHGYEALFSPLRAIPQKNDINHILLTSFLSNWREIFINGIKFSGNTGFSHSHQTEYLLHHLFENISLKETCRFSFKEENNYTYIYDFLKVFQRYIMTEIDNKTLTFFSNNESQEPMQVLNDALNALNIARDRELLSDIQFGKSSSDKELQDKKKAERKIKVNF